MTDQSMAFDTIDANSSNEGEQPLLLEEHKESINRLTETTNPSFVSRNMPDSPSNTEVEAID